MFTNDEFGLLQMISEIDVEWCASEDAGSRRRVDYEILHWLEREWNIPYKGVEISP